MIVVKGGDNYLNSMGIVFLLHQLVSNIAMYIIERLFMGQSYTTMNPSFIDMSLLWHCMHQKQRLLKIYDNKSCLSPSGGLYLIK